MKVLHLMPYSPEPPIFGGALRTYHLLGHLVDRHEVTVVCFGTPGDSSRLKEKFANVRDVHTLPFSWPLRFRRLGQFSAHWTRDSYFQFACRSKEMQSLLDGLFTRNEYDLLQVEFHFMGNFTLETDAVRVLDEHNIEYDNFRRMAVHTRSAVRRWYYGHEYKRLLREEADTCRKHDAIFLTSERDKAILDADVADVPKYIVPNGVDSSYFKPSGGPHEEFSIVFTGMMGYVPNYDGILWFLDRIFPHIRRVIPGVKIYVVGNNPPKSVLSRASDNVVITGFVEDVRPYVWKSAVYIVPLRMGGGTRLKVLEAMAMKKPIVTTSIGSEGIDVRDRESVLIADQPQAFAHSVIELLRDESLRNRLTRNGHELVRSRYEWSVIAGEVDSIYQKLKGRVSGPPPGIEKEVNIHG